MKLSWKNEFEKEKRAPLGGANIKKKKKKCLIFGLIRSFAALIASK